MIGQMMEPIEFTEPKTRGSLPAKDWATTGTNGKRKPNIINSLYLDPQKLEDHNVKLQAKYATIKENETRFESYNMENAELVLVAYGTTSRIVKNAIAQLEEQGIKVGLIRPITLWPFPNKPFEELPETCKTVMSVEMSMGQMIDDIKISVNGSVPVEFYGRSGGMIPTPEAIVEKVKEILGGAR
jgi:2-oxoglutarate ferredoxin oxidoreductase subunit alpha